MLRVQGRAVAPFVHLPAVPTVWVLGFRGKFYLERVIFLFETCSICKPLCLSEIKTISTKPGVHKGAPNSKGLKIKK